ncbi:PPK2 family polyphosphate kinase [Piscicoccus intestinalis]|uniref:PPK2 family polyphosphate kinase n=1 Tax=Piscicoccus intestinalis TaxID=746033 RepID=UPI0009FDE9CE|nr:PPK2 family polyphosphate kinase [Piscicoccus intestinalis]
MAKKSAETTERDDRREDSATQSAPESPQPGQEPSTPAESEKTSGTKKSSKKSEKKKSEKKKSDKKADKKAAKKSGKKSGKKGDSAADSVAAQVASQTAPAEIAAAEAAAEAPVESVVDVQAEAAAAPDLDGVSFSQLLRVGEGFVLADLDPASTPGFTGSKKDGERALAAGVDEISALQERLYAQARGGSKERLLLVVQGMDTSGKGGIMRHVVGLMDPQGVDLTAFKAPTPEEKKHPFLWRIRRALPKPGQVGVFDRSHYEDVLIVRVRNLVPSSTWNRRYSQINTFESSAAKDGITMIKVMLHISKAEQGQRLLERLERPDKHWKYNPGDVDERSRWEDYEVAYQVALERTSTDVAPWYVVPADRKWYARMAVQRLVLEHLRALDPQWPPADFDVEEEKRRLAET